MEGKIIPRIDKPVKSRYLLLAIVVTLLGGALAVTNLAQLRFQFHPASGIIFNPLNYGQNHTIVAGDNATLNYTNIMTLTVQKTSATITVTTQSTNTLQIFISLTLTLSFNSTQVNLNGLKNQTLGFNLNKGIYLISISLSYIVLPSANSATTAAWNINFSGN